MKTCPKQCPEECPVIPGCRKKCPEHFAKLSKHVSTVENTCFKYFKCPKSFQKGPKVHVLHFWRKKQKQYKDARPFFRHPGIAGHSSGHCFGHFLMISQNPIQGWSGPPYIGWDRTSQNPPSFRPKTRVKQACFEAFQHPL